MKSTIFQRIKFICVYVSSIVNEEAKTLSLFFKCILKKTKATKKHLKRSKSKKNKESKFVMLDSFCSLLFMSLSVKKVSTGLNE